MGLLRMLAFPITGPLWIAGVVLEQAEMQFYDVESIRRQMEELEEDYRAGEIADDDFERAQEQLLQRLIDAREYHRRKTLEDAS